MPLLLDWLFLFIFYLLFLIACYILIYFFFIYFMAPLSSSFSFDFCVHYSPSPFLVFLSCFNCFIQSIIAGIFIYSLHFLYSLFLGFPCNLLISLWLPLLTSRPFIYPAGLLINIIIVVNDSVDFCCFLYNQFNLFIIHL